MSKHLSTPWPRPSAAQMALWALLGIGIAVLAGRTPLSERADVVVPEEPFRHVYVQSRVGSETKCLVTDRAGATVRRSEPDLARARWKCRWIDGPDGPVLTALTGKEPSFVFIPESAVVDPAFPPIYEWVRRAEALPLPRVRWVHLFKDRIYRGFYLQIRLPDKDLTTELELGRGEALEIRGATASCWNRKLKPTCVLWNSAFIAEAIFPEPAWTPGSVLLHRLLGESGFEPRAFVLTELPKDGRHLWPWPLPAELTRQLTASRYDDLRYLKWTSPPGDPPPGDPPPGDPLSATALAAGDESLPSAEQLEEDLLRAVDGTGAGESMAARLKSSPSLSWLRQSNPGPTEAAP